MSQSLLSLNLNSILELDGNFLIRLRKNLIARLNFIKLHFNFLSEFLCLITFTQRAWLNYHQLIKALRKQATQCFEFLLSFVDFKQNLLLSRLLFQQKLQLFIIFLLRDDTVVLLGLQMISPLNPTLIVSLQLFMLTSQRTNFCLVISQRLLQFG